MHLVLDGALRQPPDDRSSTIPWGPLRNPLRRIDPPAGPEWFRTKREVHAPLSFSEAKATPAPEPLPILGPTVGPSTGFPDPTRRTREMRSEGLARGSGDPRVGVRSLIGFHACLKWKVPLAGGSHDLSSRTHRDGPHGQSPACLGTGQ